MKTNMKKLAAWMMVLLLVIQIIPALAKEQVEGTLEPKASLFREKLKVTSEYSILSVGESIQLTATEGYKVKWSSNNEDIATVDENGVVTAVANGTVKITASEGDYSDSITLRVIESKQKDSEDGESEETEETEPIIIVINGDKEKYVYDG